MRNVLDPSLVADASQDRDQVGAVPVPGRDVVDPDRDRLPLGAGLGDEPAGLREVGPVVGAVGAVTVHVRRQELARHLRQAVDLGEPVAVDREVERLPDADVVERREPRVQPEPEDRELRRGVELARVARLQGGRERGRPGLIEAVRRDVGGAALDRADRGRRPCSGTVRRSCRGSRPAAPRPTRRGSAGCGRARRRPSAGSRRSCTGRSRAAAAAREAASRQERRRSRAVRA